LFIAHALQEHVGDNADPWPEVNAAFCDPSILPKELRLDLKELASTWAVCLSNDAAFSGSLAALNSGSSKHNICMMKHREQKWGGGKGP
jgi:hypothetical protein